MLDHKPKVIILVCVLLCLMGGLFWGQAQFPMRTLAQNPTADPLIETAAKETLNAILTPQQTITATPSTDLSQPTSEFGAPFELLITHNQDTLTIIIAGDRTVSLEDFVISVPDQGEIQLDRFQPLRDLRPFSQIQAPICLHLERLESTRSIPTACQDNNPIVRSINPADIIWHDTLTGTTFGIQILRGDTLIDTCANPGTWCLLTYTPPLPDPSTLKADPTLIIGEVKITVDGRGVTTTNVCVETGSTVQTKASGSVRVGQFVGSVDPDGTESGFLGAPLGDSYDEVRPFPHGALMCRIQDESDWMLCGKEHEFIAETTGCLEFTLNDNDQTNNSGEFEVTITISE